VGQAAVVELRSFCTNLDLPDPAKLLDGIVTFKHDRTRLDRTMSVLGACSGLVLHPESVRRQSRTVALWELIREVMDKAADVAWPTVRLLCSRGVEIPPKNKDVDAVLKRFHPMLKEAGFLPGSRGV
jgi:hypothetical protein